MVKRVKYFPKNILHQNKQKDVEAHFDQKKKKKTQWREKTKQYKMGEERRISKVKKTVRPEWQE